VTFAYLKQHQQMEVQDIISKFNMQEHPEGGYYVESFRSDTTVEVTGTIGQKISRPASTAIYFLLTPSNISRLHRIRSDEVWHFYTGGSITIVEISENGLTETVLGQDISQGESLQHTVKANTWFGSFLNSGSPYALVGCTVAPGFVFEDFELASRSHLLTIRPIIDHPMIIKLTDGLP